MINQKSKIVLLTKENYLEFVKNSVDSKCFRRAFALIDDKKKDLLRNGELSCAYFVSSVLKIFGLIGQIHLTVTNTTEEMKKMVGD